MVPDPGRARSGHGITVITSAFQAEVAGSIPAARSLMDIINRLLQGLVGMDLTQATHLCQVSGFDSRVTREDSTHFMLTHDLRFDRVNLEVDNGIVTKADLG